METSHTAVKSVYVTQSGLPLTIELDWPFHRSTSGADFYVMHAHVHLVSGEDLHAEIAVNLSLTLKEVLPSLDRKDAEGLVINALRKQVDAKQVEFGKSVKLIPMQFSSRLYSHKFNKWVFGNATDEQIIESLIRKAFWSGKAGLLEFSPADPIDALYFGTTTEGLAKLAQQLVAKGLFEARGEKARATASLMNRSSEFEQDMSQALKALEEKHAFERG